MAYKITEKDKAMMTTRLRLLGNIIPDSWLQRIVFPASKKPHWLAAWVLSDVCYWYSPTEVKDEATGALIGYAKKYAGEYLQRSYKDIAERTGTDKKQAQRACKQLADMGLIKIHYLTLVRAGIVLNNVVHLEPIIGAIHDMTYAESWQSTVPSPKKKIDPVATDGIPSPQECPEGIDNYGETNTETTPNTIPDIYMPPTRDVELHHPAYAGIGMEEEDDTLAKTRKQLDEMEAIKPYVKAIRSVIQEANPTGQKYLDLQDLASKAMGLGVTPDHIRAAYAKAPNSFWGETWQYKKSPRKPWLSDVANTLEEAVNNKPLAGDELGAYNLLLRVKARTMQPHELNTPTLNGAGKLALAVAKRNHGLPWLDNATPEAIRAAVAGVQS